MSRLVRVRWFGVPRLRSGLCSFPAQSGSRCEICVALIDGRGVVCKFVVVDVVVIAIVTVGAVVKSRFVSVCAVKVHLWPFSNS